MSAIRLPLARMRRIEHPLFIQPEASFPLRATVVFSAATTTTSEEEFAVSGCFPVLALNTVNFDVVFTQDTDDSGKHLLISCRPVPQHAFSRAEVAAVLLEIQTSFAGDFATNMHIRVQHYKMIKKRKRDFDLSIDSNIDYIMSTDNSQSDLTTITCPELLRKIETCNNEDLVYCKTARSNLQKWGQFFLCNIFPDLLKWFPWSAISFCPASIWSKLHDLLLSNPRMLFWPPPWEEPSLVARTLCSWRVEKSLTVDMVSAMMLHEIAGNSTDEFKADIKKMCDNDPLVFHAMWTSAMLVYEMNKAKSNSVKINDETNFLPWFMHANHEERVALDKRFAAIKAAIWPEQKSSRCCDSKNVKEIFKMLIVSNTFDISLPGKITTSYSIRNAESIVECLKRIRTFGFSSSTTSTSPMPELVFKDVASNPIASTDACAIELTTENQHTILEEFQRAAVIGISENPVVLIDGRAGSGKSTVCRVVRGSSSELFTITPTNAVRVFFTKRMRESTWTVTSFINALWSSHFLSTIQKIRVLFVEEIGIIGEWTFGELLRSLHRLPNLVRMVCVGDGTQRKAIAVGDLPIDLAKIIPTFSLKINHRAKTSILPELLMLIPEKSLQQLITRARVFDDSTKFPGVPPPGMNIVFADLPKMVELCTQMLRSVDCVGRVQMLCFKNEMRHRGNLLAMKARGWVGQAATLPSKELRVGQFIVVRTHRISFFDYVSKTTRTVFNNEKFIITGIETCSDAPRAGGFLQGPSVSNTRLFERKTAKAYIITMESVLDFLDNKNKDGDAAAKSSSADVSGAPALAWRSLTVDPALDGKRREPNSRNLEKEEAARNAIKKKALLQPAVFKFSYFPPSKTAIRFKLYKICRHTEASPQDLETSKQFINSVESADFCTVDSTQGMQFPHSMVFLDKSTTNDIVYTGASRGEVSTTIVTPDLETLASAIEKNSRRGESMLSCFIKQQQA